MPKIIVQANQSDSDAGRVTLSERVVATHLQDNHYATQLIGATAWAAIDAEQLETPTDREPADKPRCPRPRRDTVPAGQSLSSPRPRPAAGTHRFDMTTKRPIATTPAPDRRPRRSGHDTTDQARSEPRSRPSPDARWLYASSCDTALRPTGELLAARLSAPRPPFRPGRARPASHLAPDAATPPP